LWLSSAAPEVSIHCKIITNSGCQCQGFLESIFALMGLDLAVPDHSRLGTVLKDILDGIEDQIEPVAADR
jgi:hypothetical protein